MDFPWLYLCLRLALLYHRYLVIVYPLRPRMSIQKAWCVLAVTWTLSLLVALPSAYFSTQIMFGSFHGSPGHKIYCVHIWTADRAHTLQVLLPVPLRSPVSHPRACHMWVLYTRICQELWLKHLPGVQTQQIQGQLRARFCWGFWSPFCCAGRHTTATPSSGISFPGCCCVSLTPSLSTTWLSASPSAAAS